MSENLSLFQSVVIPISSIELNTGQIPGVPKNPRKRDDAQLERLKKSIIDDPEMLGLRDILVYQIGHKYVVIGGNMRVEALRQLEYKEAICRVIPDGWSAAKLRAIAIKDNNSFGQWDYEMLQEEWAGDPLNDWGLDMSWDTQNANGGVVRAPPKKTVMTVKRQRRQIVALVIFTHSASIVLFVATAPNQQY